MAWQDKAVDLVEAYFIWIVVSFVLIVYCAYKYPEWFGAGDATGTPIGDGTEADNG